MTTPNMHHDECDCHNCLSDANSGFFSGQGDEMREEQMTRKQQEKLRYDLIPRGAMAGAAAVYTQAEAKYKDNSWKTRNEPISSHYAALQRHIEALRNGEDIDPESGLPHYDHAQCRLQIIGWIIRYRPELDDREKML